MDRGKTRESKVRLDKVIGRNIRNERVSRKLTRDELAEVVDITTSHLGLIERGERGATPVTLEKLVKAFDISVDSLFSESGRAAFARERRERKSQTTYYKRICTLMSHLSDAELLLLTHTIKGIVAMRYKSGTSNPELDAAFNNVIEHDI